MACARRRFSALMRPRFSPSVVCRRPASTSRVTSLSRRCCATMSGVLYRARVNMNSQTKVALLFLSNSTGNGRVFATIVQILPCGATTSAIAGKCPSISLKQRM
ncbi:hypothetical protein D3C72_2168970 [compost metagenome]